MKIEISPWSNSKSTKAGRLLSHKNMGKTWLISIEATLNRFKPLENKTIYKIRILQILKKPKVYLWIINFIR